LSKKVRSEKENAGEGERVVAGQRRSRKRIIKV
jgi:hypothetical protein